MLEVQLQNSSSSSSTEVNPPCNKEREEQRAQLKSQKDGGGYFEQLKLQKKRKYNKLRKLIESNKTNYRVLQFEDYDDPLQCIATILDKTTKERFTLKIYNMFNGVDDISKMLNKQAEQEKQTAKHLMHPNIVKFIDSFIIEKYYFIVLEYAGTQLKQWLFQGIRHLHPIHAIRFSLQLISAIKYIHNIDEQFNKLSIYNIFINEMRQIKIYKSGFVNHISTQFLDEEKEKPSPYFYPPELRIQSTQEAIISFQSEGDIWQFGIFVYLIAGASQADTVMAQQKLLKKLIRHDDKFNELVSSVLQVDQKERPLANEIEIILKELYKEEWKKPNVERTLISEVEQYKEIDPQRAISNLILLLEQKPGSTQFAYQIAEIYRKAQVYELAENWYRKCIQMQPNSQTYKERLQEVIRNQSESNQGEEQKITSTSDIDIVYQEDIFKHLVSEDEEQVVHPEKKGTKLQCFCGVLVIIGIIISVIVEYYSAKPKLPKECSPNEESYNMQHCVYKFSDKIRKNSQMMENPMYYLENVCPDNETIKKYDYCYSTSISFIFLQVLSKQKQIASTNMEHLLQFCLTLNSKNYYCYSLLSKFYLNENRVSDSELTLKECTARGEEKLDCIGGLAFHYIYTKEYENATQYINDCLKIDQNNKLCQLYQKILFKNKPSLVDLKERIFDRQLNQY